jgi:hypothetical protein
MATPQSDNRSAERRARDEEIASEPQRPPLDLPPDAKATPVERHLEQRRRHPMAVVGIVENGAVRPVDPAVGLPEGARVIIVALQEG